MYSLRNQPKTSEVSDKFWIAISSFFDYKILEGYLPDCINCWNNEIEVDDNLINLKIAKEIGIKPFPLGEKIEEAEVFDLIEAIFRIINVPYRLERTKSIGQVRYDYTIEINNIFKNFRMNYILDKGEIKSIHSAILNDMFLDELNCSDETINSFLKIALNKFRSKDIAEQRIALNKLVDAFERAKTLISPTNKSKSALKIAEMVDPKNIFFGEDMLKMTKIANNEFMIRHTEMDKTLIDSPIVLEYLFYLYYNCLRAILLSKY